MINSFLVEGKTKIIEKMNDENIIRIVTKDFLTGGIQQEEITDIGIQKTSSFYIKFAWIATSFIEQDSPNSLISLYAQEYVVRPYAWGLLNSPIFKR